MTTPTHTKTRPTVSVAEHTAAYARRMPASRRRRDTRPHQPDNTPPPGPAAAWPYARTSLRVVAAGRPKP